MSETFQCRDNPALVGTYTRVRRRRAEGNCCACGHVRGVPPRTGHWKESAAARKRPRRLARTDRAGADSSSRRTRGWSSSSMSLGSAIEQLQFGRERLWQEFRIAMPSSAGLSRFDHRADVNGIGITALSLVLGRPIAADEFPQAIPGLLMQARERSPMGNERPLSNAFRNWLGRTLQLDVRRAFASAPEALAALEETLAGDRRICRRRSRSKHSCRSTAPRCWSRALPAPALAMAPPPGRHVRTRQLRRCSCLLCRRLLCVTVAQPAVTRYHAARASSCGRVRAGADAADHRRSDSRCGFARRSAAVAYARTDVGRLIAAPASEQEDLYAAFAHSFDHRTGGEDADAAEAPVPIVESPAPPGRSRGKLIAGLAAAVAIATAGFFGARTFGKSAPAAPPEPRDARRPVESCGCRSVRRRREPRHDARPPFAARRLAHSRAARPRRAAGDSAPGAGRRSGVAVPRVRGTPTTGMLVVHSQPAGAKVTVDGVARASRRSRWRGCRRATTTSSCRATTGTTRTRVKVLAGTTASLVAPVVAAPVAEGPVSGWVSVKAPFMIEIREDGAADRHDRNGSRDAGRRPPRAGVRQPDARLSRVAHRAGGCPARSRPSRSSCRKGW